MHISLQPQYCFSKFLKMNKFSYMLSDMLSIVWCCGYNQGFIVVASSLCYKTGLLSFLATKDVSCC